MFRFVASTLLCCALAGTAAAAEAPAQQHPCQADMAKYCADAHGDRAKMNDCMHQHFSDFTPACQEHIKQRQQAHEGAGHGAQPGTESSSGSKSSGS